MGLDDSPTARYGRHVEGAGVHHHPTPGPADGKWLYGHNWVALAWLAGHPLWGVIALPLRSMLYVRQVDIPKLAEKYGWEFRTKHQLGVELLTWFMQAIGRLGVKAKVWLAVDGAMRRSLSQASPWLGHRRRQPPAQGRLPLRLAGKARSPPPRTAARLWQEQNPRGEAPASAGLAGQPESSAIDGELQAAVEAALGELPPKLRAAIVLVTMDGIDADEAARIEGCSRATMYWRLHEARKRLKQQLKGHLTP